MAIIQFVRQSQDLSTDSGFQFEFYCDRCGTGYQTRFEPSAAGTLNDVLDAAGNLFGGILSTAASLGERARSATWQKARDEAFARAVAEIKPLFKQCRDCGYWVDEICWHAKRGQCVQCAEAEEDEAEQSYVTCPSCEADVAPGKFCSECGKRLKLERKCGSCGVKGSGKFCAECGEPL